MEFGPGLLGVNVVFSTDFEGPITVQSIPMQVTGYEMRSAPEAVKERIGDRFREFKGVTSRGALAPSR